MNKTSYWGGESPGASWARPQAFGRAQPSAPRHAPRAMPANDGAPLPGVVGEIADVIGRERALRLVGGLPRCWVGREGAKSWQVMLSVPTPARLRPSHPLVTILGLEDAQRVAEAFGGEVLKPSNCTYLYRDFRDSAIPGLVRDGLSIEAVAEITGTTAAVVRRVMKNALKLQ